MEIIYYTAAAIILYLVADRIIDTAERMAGRRFEYRTIYFFAVLTAAGPRGHPDHPDHPDHPIESRRCILTIVKAVDLGLCELQVGREEFALEVADGH